MEQSGGALGLRGLSATLKPTRDRISRPPCSGLKPRLVLTADQENAEGMGGLRRYAR